MISNFAHLAALLFFITLKYVGLILEYTTVVIVSIVKGIKILFQVLYKILRFAVNAHVAMCKVETRIKTRALKIWDWNWESSAKPRPKTKTTLSIASGN